jgi:uncharacterized protein (DUF1697 family)
MTAYVAFLGGINVGGHRVTMERLRVEFEALDFGGISTFIASGNVLFTASGAAGGIERRIEGHLEDALGYAVPTFLRSRRAVTSTVALDPFGRSGTRSTHLVAFLKKAPGAAATREIAALANRQDRFEVHGRALHWLVVNGGVSDSTVKPAAVRAAVGPYTTRNVKSLRTLVGRW